MMTIKIGCSCGQNYAFDVEPVNGRMPASVACPVCGVDGTAAANEFIAQSSPPSPPPQSGPAVVTLSGAQGAALLAKHIAGASRRSENESDRKWKWWYFILAGICISGYSIWQAYNTHTLKPLGSLFLAVLCIAIGIWDFFYQRRKNQKSG